MPQWQRTLKLGDAWDAREKGEMTIQQLATTVADRLDKLRPFGGDFEYMDEQRGHIAEQFRDVADDDLADANDFDNVLSDLYDWADTRMDDHWNGKAACWVETRRASRLS